VTSSNASKSEDLDSNAASLESKSSDLDNQENTMNDTTKPQIHQLLKDATVKIWAEGKFQGSGFFVTPTGYLVTAYHCVAKPAMKDIRGNPMPQELHKTLEVETSPKVRWPAEVDTDKSLPELDIAVLKVSHSPKQYLPIGRLSEQWEGDEVVGCGCPGGNKPGMDKIATYPGIFTRILTDDRELIEVQNAISGHGQSGGAIYHYRSQRVIAIADMGFKDKTVSTAPLAVRLDKLFEKWQEFEQVNSPVAQVWEKNTASRSKSVYVTVAMAMVVIGFIVLVALPYFRDSSNSSSTTVTSQPEKGGTIQKVPLIKESSPKEPPIVLAAGGEVAGYISEFEGTSETFILKRQGKTLPVQIGMALHADDEITVSGESRLELTLVSGKKVEVTKKNSHSSSYKVEAVEQGRWATIVESLWSLFKTEVNASSSAER
jgi:hypothetical protein